MKKMRERGRKRKKIERREMSKVKGRKKDGKE